MVVRPCKGVQCLLWSTVLLKNFRVLGYGSGISIRTSITSSEQSENFNLIYYPYETRILLGWSGSIQTRDVMLHNGLGKVPCKSRVREGTLPRQWPNVDDY